MWQWYCQRLPIQWRIAHGFHGWELAILLDTANNSSSWLLKCQNGLVSNCTLESANFLFAIKSSPWHVQCCIMFVINKGSVLETRSLNIYVCELTSVKISELQHQFRDTWLCPVCVQWPERSASAIQSFWRSNEHTSALFSPSAKGFET